LKDRDKRLVRLIVNLPICFILVLIGNASMGTDGFPLQFVLSDFARSEPAAKTLVAGDAAMIIETEDGQIAGNTVCVILVNVVKLDVFPPFSTNATGVMVRGEHLDRNFVWDLLTAHLT